MVKAKWKGDNVLTYNQWDYWPFLLKHYDGSNTC